MLQNLLPKRFSLLKSFSVTYLIFAFVVRCILYVFAFNYIDFSFTNFLTTFGIGFLFDVGSLSYIIAFYALFLLLIPTRFHGNILDKAILKFFYGFFVFFLLFSFIAEVPFWLEYQRRFNFIAVDYLLYTYEVIANIDESFPIPLLIGIITFLTYLTIKFTKKVSAYQRTFENLDSFKTKLFPSLIIFGLLAVFHFTVKNTQAEIFDSVSENELAKSGLYSFFAAYKSNELNYNEFYATIPQTEASEKLQTQITASNDSLLNQTEHIYRFIKNNGKEQKPNVIFIGLESVNTRFMKRFGNTEELTPALDSLSEKSIFFTNLYATGTRTIRGMEAISMSIPPTPGRSIVKRENNQNVFTIGEVFKQKGYSRTFFYGGDGHFDNMTNFFSYNGFDIVDRRKLHRLPQELPTTRTRIENNEVTFENAWGICDADLYNKLLNTADDQHKTNKPFFNFIMTSSNHKPYTYPDGVVDIPSGTSRTGALRYADKAFENFFEKAKNKPWFQNTVFVVMADHCAYSAGRTEINVENHHIPAFIFNLKNKKPREINKLSSQIDIFPTLFGYLNWSYASKLFGKDITKMSRKDERAFIGNHRKVGLLKHNKLLILETQKKHVVYNYNKKSNKLTQTKSDNLLLKETISYYQSAYSLFKNGGLQIDE